MRLLSHTTAPLRRRGSDGDDPIRRLGVGTHGGERGCHGRARLARQVNGLRVFQELHDSYVEIDHRAADAKSKAGRVLLGKVSHCVPSRRGDRRPWRGGAPRISRVSPIRDRRQGPHGIYESEALADVTAEKHGRSVRRALLCLERRPRQHRRPHD